MVNKCMERSSALLAIKEMQIKAIVREHLMPTKMAVIIKRQIIINVGEYVEKSEPSFTAGGKVK